jgi:signal transduction histidine kinase/ligand-binding sensor domain-containing protein/DNA-binding NarL/FixJ family response regulator
MALWVPSINQSFLTLCMFNTSLHVSILKTLKTRLAFFILILWTISTGFGQVPKPRFRHLGIENGLSQSQVTSICQDYKGFMWFGTRDGLNRYDGYNFRVYKADTYDTESISDNHITSVFEDFQKNLWIGTMHGGLLVYDRKKDAFIKINMSAFPKGVQFVSNITGNRQVGVLVSFLSGEVFRVMLPDSTERITTTTLFSTEKVAELKVGESQVPFNIFLTPKSVLLLNGTKGFKIYSLATGSKVETYKDYPTYRVRYKGNIPLPRERSDTYSPLIQNTQDMRMDENGHIWMTSSLGLYQLNPVKKEFVLYHFADNTTSLLPIKRNSDKTQIWVATHREGLAIFHPHDSSVSFLKNTEIGNEDATDMRFNVIYEGRDGDLWLGANGRGIFAHSPNLTLFNRGEQQASGKTKDKSKSTYALLNVKPGGGTVLYSTLNAFTHVEFSGGEITRNDTDPMLTTRSMSQDINGHVWLGNHHGLFRYNPLTRLAEKMIQEENQTINSVFAAADGRIWYTTYTSLCSFDPRTGNRQGIPFPTDLTNRLESLLISMIQPDYDGTLWVGTGNGLYHFNPSISKFIHVFRNVPSDKQSLSSNEVKSILPDPINPAQFLWIGTPFGLNLLDKRTGKFSHFTTKDGLPNNTVYGVLSDKKGNLWLSTNQGISVFNPVKRTFINFDQSNGLQSNEFNTGAYFKSIDGEMYFGGINGYNRFYPEQILIPGKDLPMVISEIRLLGDESGERYFFSEDKPNLLSHSQNNLTVTMSLLDYSSSDKIQYAYRIVNRDTSWINIGKTRSVTLTNLSPGTYVFEGRGTDGFGRWSGSLTTITFKIASPWWNSPLSRFCYLVAVSGLLFVLWKRYKRRLIHEQRIETDQQKAQSIMELAEVKSRFLANITHEFRTPLTLINGHIERLKSEETNTKSASSYREMERNSQHLLRLINQLMDLSKLESGEFRIRYKRNNILNDLKVTTYSFHSYAAQRNIELLLKIDEESNAYLSENPVLFDENVFITILNNLLSNACKFTGEGGAICVDFRFEKDSGKIYFSVSDTGPGIPEEEQEKIFDRFYQSDNSAVHRYEGSGIGLSLVKELAQLHGGNVSLESDVDKGSTFSVYIQEGLDEDLPEGSSALTATYAPSQDEVQPMTDEELPLIMIVEDHPELRRFIRECLGLQYRFLEATNGRIGLELAINHIPDLIISDVMMPEMDGFEFCDLVKKQELTSHIPLILLTARVDQEDKLTGLRKGADDYLSKPFSTAELLLRVRNIIAGRKLLIERHSVKALSKLAEPAILPEESVFVSRLTSLIENHLSDPGFGVEELAGLTFISTSQLQRKLKAITDKSPSALILDIRMSKSIALLQKGQESIGEISFQVGFENHSYFSRVFKKHFGFMPSEKERVNAYFNK